MSPIIPADTPVAQSTARGAEQAAAAATIDMLILNAFSNGRAPRSSAYKDGMRALLAQRFNLGAITCPFRAGSAEFDAFFAGADEGRAVWMEYQSSKARAA